MSDGKETPELFRFPARSVNQAVMAVVLEYVPAASVLLVKSTYPAAISLLWSVVCAMRVVVLYV